MDKFSKIKEEEVKSEKDVLYSDDYMSIVRFEDWSVLEEPDLVICVPIIIEYNQFIIRQEYIPSYKLSEGKEFHITVLSGTIDENETPEQALKRELEEEAGIVLRDNFEFNFESPIFKSKTSSSKYHICILPLSESDYHEVSPTGDGSASEKVSKSVKVNIKHINSIIPSDTITQLMIYKVKEYLNV